MTENMGGIAGGMGPLYGSDLVGKADPLAAELQTTDNLEKAASMMFGQFQMLLGAKPSEVNAKLEPIREGAGKLHVRLEEQIAKISKEITGTPRTVADAKKEVARQAELMRLHRASAQLDALKPNVDDPVSFAKLQGGVRTAEDSEKIKQLEGKVQELRKEWIESNREELQGLGSSINSYLLGVPLPLWNVQVEGKTAGTAMRAMVNEISALTKELADFDIGRRGSGALFDTKRMELMTAIKNLDDFMTVVKEGSPDKLRVKKKHIDDQDFSRTISWEPYTTAKNAGDIADAATKAWDGYNYIRGKSPLFFEAIRGGV